MEVLVGVNGTNPSLEALEMTIQRAEKTDDRVIVVVLDDPSTELTEQELRDRVESMSADTDVVTEIQVSDGDPGPELVSVAETKDVQQVVLGDRSRSPMGKIQIDRIVQYVLFNTQRTVKLVR